MAHRKTTLAYGVVNDPRHKYVLEDYSDFSRNHNKAVSIRRWKRDLKSKARQAAKRHIQKVLCRDTED